MLYALHQQAVVGPCKEPKPWSWNIVESAKWNSWSQLKDMSSVEAMRLYVKLLEEEVQVSKVAVPDARSVLSISTTPVHCAELLGDRAMHESPTVLQPDWWVLARSADLQKDAPPPNAAAEGSKKQRSLRDSAVQGSWAAADAGGAKRPPPRYEHAVALVRRTLYIVGGNCGEGLLCLAARLLLRSVSLSIESRQSIELRHVPSTGCPRAAETQVWAATVVSQAELPAGGRYLNDVWTLDLETLVWQLLSTRAVPREDADGAEVASEEGAALLQPAFPPLAGHALVVWGTSILCIGGHTKVQGLPLPPCFEGPWLR